MAARISRQRPIMSRQTSSICFCSKYVGTIDVLRRSCCVVLWCAGKASRLPCANCRLHESEAGDSSVTCLESYPPHFARFTLLASSFLFANVDVRRALLLLSWFGCDTFTHSPVTVDVDRMTRVKCRTATVGTLP